MWVVCFCCLKPIIVLSDLDEVEAVLGRRNAEFHRAPTTLNIFKCWGEFGLLALQTGRFKRCTVGLKRVR